jgi:predicted alpha/beta superfamily hydrolase
MKPTFKLPSPETGTEYWIYVEAPVGTGPWPALIFLDGDDQFAGGVAAYRESVANAAAPPLLLVGIGYGASYAKPANKRGRDYTPAFHSDEPGSGGAPAFLSFLSTTLWPELTRRYALNAAARGIAGHSLSSLFVLHALFQPRPFFTHHLASAPSIWWADRAMLQQIATFRAGQDKLPARLFLGVGENDTASMTGDLALLEAQLAEKPFAGLEIISRRFAKRNHFNVLPVAFATGIQVLFGPADK